MSTDKQQRLEKVESTDEKVPMSVFSELEHLLEQTPAQLKQKQIARAKHMREIGRKKLQKHYDGMLCMVQTLCYWEQTVASIFERNFAYIETSCFILSHVAASVVSEKQYVLLQDVIKNRIESTVEHFDQSLKQSQCLLINHEELSNVRYVKAGLNSDVHIRTPLAIRTLEIFTKFDSIIQTLRKCYWHGIVDAMQISQAELKGKSEIIQLRRFLLQQAQEVMQIRTSRKNKNIENPNLNVK